MKNRSPLTFDEWIKTQEEKDEKFYESYDSAHHARIAYDAYVYDFYFDS